MTRVMEQFIDTALQITSPAFKADEWIPQRYTCDGKNVNPPLRIDDLPKQTKSLVLIIDDPDAPISAWDHWVVWNIPIQYEIKENTIPGIEGINSFQRQHYGGPCPPGGTHRYFFKVYALDILLSLVPGATKKEVEKAMEGHVLAFGQLVGLYKRQ